MKVVDSITNHNQNQFLLMCILSVGAKNNKLTDYHLKINKSSKHE